MEFNWFGAAMINMVNRGRSQFKMVICISRFLESTCSGVTLYWTSDSCKEAEWQRRQV